MKLGVGKRSLQKEPSQKEPKFDGSVTVGIIRKYSVAQYETLDVTVSVTANANPGEDQFDVTHRVYSRLKTDARKICEEMFQKARDKEI
jgi:hypothetical protein